MFKGAFPMQRNTVMSSSCVFVLTIALTATLTACGRVSKVESQPTHDPVERGRYLVEIAACNDCHTPMILGENGPEPDLSRALSGHPADFQVGAPPALGEGGWLWAGAGTNTAFTGPWGTSFAANLTPDDETGLGVWTEDMFIKAIREGKAFGGGRQIMPPMPWPAYSHMTDDDLKAVFAYLKSLKPISNKVPDYRPPAE